MDIKAYKTTELTETQIKGIYDLFATVFNKERTNKDFHNQFENTSKGYSYHAIAEENGKIVGHNAYVPFTYLHEDKPFTLCLSLDAMVHPDWQGKGVYRKLLSECERCAKDDGCALRIGFPNYNSFPIQTKRFGYDNIGNLSTYILPLNVKKLFPAIGFLNPLINLFTRGIVAISRLSRSSKEYVSKIRKDRKEFDSIRYNWFGSDYTVIEKGGFRYVYRDSEFKGKEATFLMDVWPLTKRNFNAAVRAIYNQKKHNSPILIYVGNLPFIPMSMIKVPAKMEPKKFHFVGKILNKELIGPECLDIKNWELNLSNYDLL